MELINELKKTPRHGHGVSHRTDQPILRVAHLTVRYDGKTALENLTFHLHTGERIAVVGPNGAGKSTLFKVIAGVLAPTSGELDVYGAGPGGHICIGYVPQRSQVDWNFPVTVTDVVMMGRVGKLGFLRWPRRRDWLYVRQSLDEVGLGDLAERQISELSGGQQQRMFIARALAQEAELLLMDEPLTGLDLQSQESIFAILDELGQRKVTVMVATHDLDQAAQRFDRVMLLNRRLIGLGNPTDVFTTDRLVQAYGRHLHLVDDNHQLIALTDTCCDEGTSDG
jgi:manganese/iron transport system ATP-binding protein